MKLENMHCNEVVDYLYIRGIKLLFKNILKKFEKKLTYKKYDVKLILVSDTRTS